MWTTHPECGQAPSHAWDPPLQSLHCGSNDNVLASCPSTYTPGVMPLPQSAFIPPGNLPSIHLLSSGFHHDSENIIESPEEDVWMHMVTSTPPLAMGIASSTQKTHTQNINLALRHSRITLHLSVALFSLLSAPSPLCGPYPP